MITTVGWVFVNWYRHMQNFNCDWAKKCNKKYLPQIVYILWTREQVKQRKEKAQFFHRFLVTLSQPKIKAKRKRSIPTNWHQECEDRSEVHTMWHSEQCKRKWKSCVKSTKSKRNRNFPKWWLKGEWIHWMNVITHYLLCMCKAIHSIRSSFLHYACECVCTLSLIVSDLRCFFCQYCEEVRDDLKRIKAKNTWKKPKTGKHTAKATTISLVERKQKRTFSREDARPIYLMVQG